MLEASLSLILFPVGRGCKAQCSFRFPAAQAFKVEKGISVGDCQQTHRQHGRICSPLVPDFYFSAFMPACMRPFHQVPCGMRIFRGDLHIWKPASLLHVQIHSNPSPTLSAHPANRLCTAMHDKGMWQFDKDEPQRSGDPLSQHEPTSVINQQCLFTSCRAV